MSGLQRRNVGGPAPSSKEEQHTHEEHAHSHEHEHSHSSVFSHSHDHSELGATDDAAQIIAALKGQGDRGSRVTLLGLLSNIVLTGLKGAAGWYMHSAVLLADAGHSLSDLVADVVVLACWQLSRRSPTDRYPFGFAKFETLGTTTMSLLLIGGALGIGFHSYSVLLQSITETASSLPPGALQTAMENVTIVAPIIPETLQHGHDHIEVVDPNAAWFALLSIGVKEWMFRLTKKVAEEEHSPVLMANAIHHKSDVYTSIVTVFAILGNWLFPAIPLDPIGGLLVSVLILKQSFGLLSGTWGDLTDAGVSLSTRKALKSDMIPLLSSSTSSSISSPHLLDITDIRARRAGSLIYVDLTAEVAETLTVADSTIVEDNIGETMKKARKEVAEVRVKFVPRTTSTSS